LTSWSVTTSSSISTGPRSFCGSWVRSWPRAGRVQIITPNGRQDLAYTRRAHSAGIPLCILLNHILFFRPGTLRLALESVGLSPLQLYCYDIRNAWKDFGLFGAGRPVPGAAPPSMEEALLLEERKTLSLWTPEKVEELRSHPKSSWAYGLLKETVPGALRLRLPERLELGHEIYALAEKRKG
jgi:hypothetical protein